MTTDLLMRLDTADDKPTAVEEHRDRRRARIIDRLRPIQSHWQTTAWSRNLKILNFADLDEWQAGAVTTDVGGANFGKQIMRKRREVCRRFQLVFQVGIERHV